MEILLLIIFYFFLVVATIQVVYYLFIFGKFSFSHYESGKENNISVSILVCAKNEEENLKKLIPLLVKQNYSNFEIVIIDDASSDNTIELVEEFQKETPNLKLVKVENNEAFWGNKKFALTLGIKATTKEYLLLTDADCFPNSPNWIKEMTSQFTTQKTIVLGYGAYEKKPGVLNKLIRFETLLTAIQYFSWAKLGKPYMGVGRNLAYKREEFFNNNGFINHIKIRSGDDDLFINEAANKNNTTLCYSPQSFTYSVPKKSFSKWFMQKRRHISTVKHYKSFDRFQLALFYITQLLFILLPIVLFIFQYQWIIVLSVFMLRYIISWVTIFKAAKQLNENDVTYAYPIWEFILIFTQLNVFIKNKISKPVTWK